MYMFLGNDEQWEDMLREEGRLDDLGNKTNVTEAIVDVVTSAAKACVGAACVAAGEFDDSE
eukprot:scaffold179152_cov39-Attheya_sp.AAC.2